MIDTLLDISKIDAGLVKPTLAPMSLADLFAALRAGLQRDGARPRPRLPRRRRPPPRSSPTARWSSWRCATCSPTRSSSPAAAACCSAAGAGAAKSASRSPTPASASPPTGRERVFEEFHRDKTTPNGPNEGIGLGLADRPAPGGADGRLGRAALAAGQGQRLHAVAARGGVRRRAPSGASRRRTPRSPAAAFSFSTTTR